MFLLCQQTSPKRWFGNMNMTSNRDVTKRAHQIQMTRHTIRPVLAGTVPVWRLCAGVPVSLPKSPGYAFSQSA